MSSGKLASEVAAHIHQMVGWQTDRKIVVLESDDWGSIRTPSRQAYKQMLEKGLQIDDHYNRFDGLASDRDLEALFEVLSSYRDGHGKMPVITANCLLANPDFKRIRNDDFQQYHFEPFVDSLARQQGCENAFRLWKEGRESGIFIPQFHGREHLNVDLWMKALRENHKETRMAFDYGFWGHLTTYPPAKRAHFMAAFDYETARQLAHIKEIVLEGLAMFGQLFGYTSHSFIAPNFIWDGDIESVTALKGVRYIQGQRKQLLPLPGKGHYKKRPHYTGQHNAVGQTYLIRNAWFEPSSDQDHDWVTGCLKDIARAFFWRKPVIVSTHRVNYTGSLVMRNRDRNLKLLHQLFAAMLKRWPDIEFMTTDALGRVIDSK